MAKYIINVTFCVENQYVSQWKMWINDVFLPLMRSHYSSPRFMRVMAQVEPGLTNYSVQHEAGEFHDLTIWKHELEKRMEDGEYEEKDDPSFA